MSESFLIDLAILLPITGIISLPLLPHFLRAKANFLMVLLVAVVTSVLAVMVLTGNDLEILLGNPPLFGNIFLHIDSLSAWFILIINLTCINGVFYGIGYLKPYDKQRAKLTLHWILLLLFQSSMLWVCMVQHSLIFLIVWELMAISSFLLILFEHGNKSTLQAGINYLVQMHLGVLFLVAAFVWIYVSQGSFEFSAIAAFFSSNPNLSLFILFFIGFGLKAGFIPMHSWLPQAHPAAPSHISGVMSGVIVKLGIYGILRIAGLLRQDFNVIGEIVIGLSVFTALYGILNAAFHRDFKRMLAYCTIENIGIIGIGIGLGIIAIGMGNPLLTVLGFASALLHTLNHSLIKSLLFFSAGAVYQQTHTRDMEKLGGLIHRMPQTASLFLVGSIAIVGMPPFNGFVSEFILYSGLITGINSAGIPNITLMIYAFAGLALTGGISILTFTKGFGTIFLGTPRMPLHEEPHEVSMQMRVPQYFIVIVMLTVGIFPQFYFSMVSEIVLRFIPSLAAQGLVVPASLINSISVIGQLTLLLILLTAAIFAIRKGVTMNRPVTEDITWGCGYVSSSPRMQYTGKSYSKSLGKLLSFIVLEQKNYKEIEVEEIFPAERKYSSHYNDFFVRNIIDGLVSRLLHTFNYFQFIQNGKIQMYILYGLIFIFLILFGSVLKVL
jgi:hydrogenase-4 component B